MFTHSILIIDDESAVRMILKKALKKLNYDIYLAENGQQGYELFEKHKPTIVILDLRMPVMDGYAFLEKVRPKPDDSYVIIILTGHGNNRDIERVYQLGANTFLYKPVNITEVRESVKKNIALKEFQERLKYQKIQLSNEIKERQKLELLQRETNDRLESLYQQLRHEYHFAAQVFSNISPDDVPKCSNVKMLLSPLDIVCGDLVIAIPKPSGGLYAFLGDFTGHGLSAAIGAVPVSSCFYKLTFNNRPIYEIISEINKILKGTLPTGLFLAACLLEWDPINKTITVWNGGIPDVIVVSKNGGVKFRIPSSHLPLGVVDNSQLSLDVEIHDVEEEDSIYLYSDGIIETFNPKGEIFGQKRLENLFINDFEPTKIMNKIRKELDNFRGLMPQKDDISLMEISCVTGSVEFTPHKDDKKVARGGWELSFSLDAYCLRTMDITSFLIKIIEKDLKLSAHKEDIFLVLNELIANAISYGILKLKSEKEKIEDFEKFMQMRHEAIMSIEEGWLRVKLEYIPKGQNGKLIIQIEDSGSGFNYQRILVDLADNIAFGGRGLQLVRSICEEVTFHGNGNKVRAVYVW